jgi:hypothetical protein
MRLVHKDPLTDARPRVLITLLGLDRETAEQLLPGATEAAEKAAEFPIVVVSVTDVFATLVARRVAFEFVPPYSLVRLAGREAWESYAAKKMDLIRAKWKPAAEMSLGMELHEFLAEGAAD